ncbi:MAG: hemolysin family protein [Thermoleophilia bacterium]|nr:hemolysin family protein [Thermoleophilia bacterium]
MTRDDMKSEMGHLRDEGAALLETYLARPLLRGVSHACGAFLAVVALVVLVAEAGAPLQLVGATVFGAGALAMLTTSALYHRIRWRPSAHRWVKKLDHSMIFVLIASTYTPFILVGFHGSVRIMAICAIWSLTAVGVVLRLTVSDLPRALQVAIYLGLGWGALTLIPAMHGQPVHVYVLAVIGGLLYTFGGVVYLLRRPNPFPRVFGFHEVFHACVIAAVACHYAAIYPLVTQ